MLLETNNPAATRWTALALAAVGKPGLPPLVTALTNSQTISLRRCYMTGSLGAMGTNAQSCIPALQHALEDSNWIVRVSATNVLRRIQPQAPGEGDGQ
jgi:hypothetical protein